jgi:hypothetical protein
MPTTDERRTEPRQQCDCITDAIVVTAQSMALVLSILPPLAPICGCRGVPHPRCELHIVAQFDIAPPRGVRSARSDATVAVVPIRVGEVVHYGSRTDGGGGGGPIEEQVPANGRGGGAPSSGRGGGGAGQWRRRGCAPVEEEMYRSTWEEQASVTGSEGAPPSREEGDNADQWRRSRSGDGEIGVAAKVGEGPDLTGRPQLSQQGDVQRQILRGSQNHLKPVKIGVHGQLYPVCTVRWTKIHGFRL